LAWFLNGLKGALWDVIFGEQVLKEKKEWGVLVKGFMGKAFLLALICSASTSCVWQSPKLKDSSQAEEPKKKEHTPYYAALGDDVEFVTPNEGCQWRGIASFDELNNREEACRINPLFANLPADIVQGIGTGLNDRVVFWTKIFGEYTSGQVAVHDTDHIHVIYSVVDVSDIVENDSWSWGYQRRQVRRRVLKERKRIRSVLKRVHRKRNKPETMNAEEKDIYNQFASVKGDRKFWNAARLSRIRGQQGLKDRTIEAMKIAGRYLDRMETIFRDHGLPVILTRLPYVESSFNVKARSKVGASGVWQFMPGTARFFGLKVNDVVDERNDPILATHAAARMFAHNFQKLDSWPLTLTSYNFGLGNLMRAKRRVRSRNLEDIIENYRGRRFGFASSNFYASYLASLIVERDREHYFGEVIPYDPLELAEVELDRFVYLKDLERYTDLDKDTILEHNPALNYGVRRGYRRIPKGYALKVPKEEKDWFTAQMAEFPENRLFARQAIPRYHRVRRGQNLSVIADRYRVSLRKILRANSLSTRSKIYPGQRIKIPR
jgi:membrane-bound lytic murein transglycosylase D